MYSMLRSLGQGLVICVMCVGFAVQPALADEPAPPTPSFEMKFDVPKAWTASQAKRGTADVMVYTISTVKDAAFVVYPPSDAYGSTIPTAIAAFMTKGLGVKVVSRYPKKLRERVTWHGVKHSKQHAMTKAKRRYGIRVVYAFKVKGFIQIAVGEAASSRLVKQLLTALSPVTMGASTQKRGAAKKPAAKPAPEPPKPPTTPPAKKPEPVKPATPSTPPSK